MRASDQTLNRLTVLKAIRRFGPISRSELPRLTGLSGGTITQLTADLVERELVSERREQARRLGRPPVKLEIDAGAAVVIGAGLGAKMGSLTITFVDLIGTELFAIDLGLGPVTTIAEFGERIADVIEQAIAASPFAPATIARAGLALPAVIDSGRGTVHFMATLPPGPFAMADLLARRIGLPVTIENSLSCMARAEHWFGRAQTLDTFTLVSVGYSVGSAEYLDGLPKSGANGLNPELGHVKVAVGDGARPCYCGGKGCLSAYASMYGILEQTDLFETIPPPDLRDIDGKFDALLDRAERGDGAAIALFDGAAEHLGVALANHLTTTDPGNVLVAFGSARFLERIGERLRDALARNTLAGVLAASEVEFIVADPEWWQGGTAALALEQTYLGLGSGPIMVESKFFSSSSPRA